MKRLPTGWKKIFANHVTDKNLIQVLIQFNITKTSNPIKKNGQKTYTDIFPKKTFRWSKTHEKCSTLLIIREMQIKITMRDHLTQVKIDIFKKSTDNKCW